MHLKRGLVIFSILIIQLTIAITGGVVLAYVAANRTVPSGVFIGDVEVSNLTESQAIEKITANVAGKLQGQKLLLRGEGKNFFVSLDRIQARYDINASVDKAMHVRKSGNIVSTAFKTFKAKLARTQPVHIALNIAYDPQLLSQRLETFKTQVEVPVSNASLRVEQDEIRLTPEVIGKKMNVAKTMQKIRENIGRTAALEMVIEDIIPEVTREDLTGIQEVVGEFTTVIPESNDHYKDDIRIVTAALDKIIVKAGGEISLLQLLQEKTQSYQDIGLSNNPGVNQIVSTLYNALLAADISIVERTSEKFAVDYIEPGREAVIEEPYIDFVFKNNKRFPILILIANQDEKITVKVFGSVLDKE